MVTTIGISLTFSIKMDTLFFVMAEKKSRCHITNAQNLCNMTPRAQIFDLLKKILLSNYIYPQNIRRNEDALNLHFHVSKSSLLFISHPSDIQYDRYDYKYKKSIKFQLIRFTMTKSVRLNKSVPSFYGWVKLFLFKDRLRPIGINNY